MGTNDAKAINHQLAVLQSNQVHTTRRQAPSGCDEHYRDQNSHMIQARKNEKNTNNFHLLIHQRIPSHRYQMEEAGHAGTKSQCAMVGEKPQAEASALSQVNGAKPQAKQIRQMNCRSLDN